LTPRCAAPEECARANWRVDTDPWSVNGCVSSRRYAWFLGWALNNPWRHRVSDLPPARTPKRAAQEHACRRSSGSREPLPLSGAGPYGEHSGTDAVTTVAAPLLAAAAVTLAGVIIQQEDALRLPGTTLLILTGAILVLVASVQCGAWARRYMTTPDQMHSWWPGANPARRAIIEQEQRLYSKRLNIWAGLAALTFNVGLVLLWSGLSVALVPTDNSAQPGLRWVACVVAATGAVIEVIWVIVAQSARYRRRRRASTPTALRDVVVSWGWT
jgi:hypothetical protein